MKNLIRLTFAAAVLTLVSARGGNQPTISGDYVEARTCNVYAGTCFVNGEMGLTGKEGILAWSVRQGSWRGIDLTGLSVIAAIGTTETMGDQRLKPCVGKAVLIVDANANDEQQKALVELARSFSGTLTAEVIEIKQAELKVAFKRTPKSNHVTVTADRLVDISVSDLSRDKSPCGHAEIYYPPLTQIGDPRAAFTEFAAFRGKGLNRQWEITSIAGAYYGTFSK